MVNLQPSPSKWQIMIIFSMTAHTLSLSTVHAAIPQFWCYKWLNILRKKQSPSKFYLICLSKSLNKSIRRWSCLDVCWKNWLQLEAPRGLWTLWSTHAYPFVINKVSMKSKLTLLDFSMHIPSNIAFYS